MLGSKMNCSPEKPNPPDGPTSIRSAPGAHSALASTLPRSLMTDPPDSSRQNNVEVESLGFRYDGEFQPPGYKTSSSLFASSSISVAPFLTSPADVGYGSLKCVVVPSAIRVPLHELPTISARL